MLRVPSFSLALPVLIAGLFIGAGAPTESMAGVITVESSSIGATTTLGGTVVPFREVAFSAQMPGRVVYIAGIEGDWFKEGEVLAALNNDDLLAKRRAARAALANARSNCSMRTCTWAGGVSKNAAT